jgi:hypothetical protein
MVKEWIGMATKVTAQAVGGETKTFENIGTVADLKTRMGLPGYQAAINGEPADDDEALPDYAFVSLSAPVKGGC